MIPIRDDNPTANRSVMTVALIVINVLVFLVEKAQPDMDRFVWRYGYVPAELVENREELRRDAIEHSPGQVVVGFNRFGEPIVRPAELPFDEIVAVPAWINIFTCMFLHGGWLHLLGNMLYLWIFGNNIEDRLGPLLYLIFYLATGVAGNLAHTVYEAGLLPLVGASGAISGVMGAYVLLFPHARVLAVVPLGWYWFTVKLPAWIFLGMYIIFQNVFPVLGGAIQGQTRGGVAFLAHIGGFFAGMALIYVFPHRPIPQFTRYAPIPDDDADLVI